MADVRERILAATRGMERAIQQAFIEAIESIRSETRQTAIIEHLRRGDIESAIEVLRLNDRLFAPLDQALARAYNLGGVAALAALPRLTDPFPGAASLSNSMPAHHAQSNGCGGNRLN